MMRGIRCAFRCVVVLFALLIGQGAYAAGTAKGLIGQAIAAQGGAGSLQSARLIEWRMEGYRNMLEQSERPDGPYIPELQSVREVHDFAQRRFAAVAQSRVPLAFQDEQTLIADTKAAVRVAGGRAAPGTAEMVRTGQDLLALSPERVLLTALQAPDLTQGVPVQLQSIPQDVVTFTLDTSPVKLFLNRYTHLPTAVEYSGPAARQNSWRYAGGDVTMRIYYSFWWLGEGGVRLPMQWDIYRNGLHDSTLIASSVAWNNAVDDASLHISPDQRTAFAKQASAPAAVPSPGPPQEIAPGVTLLPGAWNVALIRQRDGLVILEAPISSAYSEQVLAVAQKLYPNVPVKAVLSTSDAWPHIAGIRPYVARGIAIYALRLNQAALNRVLTADFSHQPDKLQLHPRKPQLILVDKKTKIGAGDKAIDLYPLRGETSERQMMAYLPALRLLYGSDPFQQYPDGSLQTAQAVDEVLSAVAREGLRPTRFFMMHIPAMDWSKVPETLAAEKLRFPNGKLN